MQLSGTGAASDSAHVIAKTCWRRSGFTFVAHDASCGFCHCAFQQQEDPDAARSKPQSSYPAVDGRDENAPHEASGRLAPKSVDSPINYAVLKYGRSQCRN